MYILLWPPLRHASWETGWPLQGRPPTVLIYMYLAISTGMDGKILFYTLNTHLSVVVKIHANADHIVPNVALA